ncbi:hypothetical protein [Streptomyces longispororuber]|uniref:hypothetical protein n=1 Tax=Streptomyces longispororuber TaxID=68230 RepID=UPI00210D8656|nr:hypothetical protein [Streptomyces longispororuber]MCQ4213387.1 hypothetical protein [Streptomyces longispororuber]
MTKRGSNAHKARVRARAEKTGLPYRQAAKELAAAREQDERERAERHARTRALAHTPENLADEREYYLEKMLAADLPDSVRVCLFALADRVGTARLTDTRGVSFTYPDLVARTGLAHNVVEDSLNLAHAHGWLDDLHGDVRLSVPGENIEMYTWFLSRVQQPVHNREAYQQILHRLERETARQAQEAVEARAFIEDVLAAKAAAHDTAEDT